MSCEKNNPLRFKNRPQCGLLIENARGEVLLQLRDDNPGIAYPDCWGTFGGQIEEGELPEQAIIRELEEELAYRPQALQQYGVYHCDGYEIYMFRCIDSSLKVHALQVQEGRRAGFFSCADLGAEPFAFNCREIMQDYFSRFHREEAVYIGLGSNLGDRDYFLAEALRLLGKLMHVDAVSSTYESEPVDYKNQPWFLNMAVRCRTRLFPQVLLEKLHTIESALGRVRDIPKGPRTIDLDILLYGDARIASRKLIVPHPLLHERSFVLEPLAEIDPGLVHPALHKSMASLLAENKRRTQVVKKTAATITA